MTNAFSPILKPFSDLPPLPDTYIIQETGANFRKYTPNTPLTSRDDTKTDNRDFLNTNYMPPFTTNHRRRKRSKKKRKHSKKKNIDSSSELEFPISLNELLEEGDDKSNKQSFGETKHLWCGGG
eukprot:CAMPEP_0117421810 /NCGR_PEP_ID=MMETSP0758-20121206/2791_1 /TAXON_ID=63605 /ORGANISM="Percolomonas cosmopolitus, Strain AE-1 (ATCC 50343)" /LENGTH=123 /DNA_ID=CAMNT_0005204085 /DNA_START=81 /DNA_END=448 /DNA_ORIENTATION=-